MELLKRFFYEILAKREGNAFHVEVSYDRLPDFCFHCQIKWHSVGNGSILRIMI